MGEVSDKLNSLEADERARRSLEEMQAQLAGATARFRDHGDQGEVASAELAGEVAQLKVRFEKAIGLSGDVARLEVRCNEADEPEMSRGGSRNVD